MNNKLIPIRVDAIRPSTDEHPQKFMKRVAEALGAKIVYAEPIAVADCWFFILKLDLSEDCHVMDSSILEHYQEQIEAFERRENHEPTQKLIKRLKKNAS